VTAPPTQQFPWSFMLRKSFGSGQNWSAYNQVEFQVRWEGSDGPNGFGSSGTTGDWGDGHPISHTCGWTTSTTGTAFQAPGTNETRFDIWFH
jgi:hypothetical protein